jgi:hypothetical protein
MAIAQAGRYAINQLGRQHSIRELALALLAVNPPSMAVATALHRRAVMVRAGKSKIAQPKHRLHCLDGTGDTPNAKAQNDAGSLRCHRSPSRSHLIFRVMEPEVADKPEALGSALLLSDGMLGLGHRGGGRRVVVADLGLEPATVRLASDDQVVGVVLEAVDGALREQLSTVA